MIKRINLICIILFLLLSGHANSKPSLSDYAASPEVSMVNISPSGDRIAYRQKNDKGDVAVVYSLKENKIIEAFSLEETNPEYMEFVSDDKLIIRAGKQSKIPGYRGEGELTSAYVLHIDSGKIHQLLTAGNGIFLGQFGLGRVFGISGDGKSLLMPAYVGEYHDQTPKYSLVKANLNKKRKPKVAYGGSDNSIGFIVDANGEVIADERYNERSNKYQIFSLASGKKKEIYSKISSVHPIRMIGVSEDYKSAIVTASNSDSDSTAYYKLDLLTGEFSDPLFKKEGADVESSISDINQRVFGVRYSGFYPTYEFSDSKLHARIENLLEKLKHHSVYLISWTPDWKKIVVYVEGNSIVGDYFIVDEKNQLQFIASTRRQIATEDINPVATYTFEASDGMKIPTLLTIPVDKLEKMENLPAIMLPHGGPQSYDTLGFDYQAQALATEGYLVIQPQFRGSDGFGVNHTLAGHGEIGKKMQQDLVDAINSLTRKKYIDPSRVCIVGSSYGGYAALAGGAFDSDLYKCIVSINGVTDFPKMISTDKSDYGNKSWIVSYWGKFITGSEDYDKDRLKEVSPSYHAENFKAPVLLIHGEEDLVVNIDQSKKMYRKLKSAKKEVEFIKLKDENHHLINLETRKQALKATIDFVNKHLKES